MLDSSLGFIFSSFSICSFLESTLLNGSLIWLSLSLSRSFSSARPPFRSSLALNYLFPGISSVQSIQFGYTYNVTQNSIHKDNTTNKLIEELDSQRQSHSTHIKDYGPRECVHLSTITTTTTTVNMSLLCRYFHSVVIAMHIRCHCKHTHTLTHTKCINLEWLTYIGCVRRIYTTFKVSICLILYYNIDEGIKCARKKTRILRIGRFFAYIR